MLLSTPPAGLEAILVFDELGRCRDGRGGITVRIPNFAYAAACEGGECLSVRPSQLDAASQASLPPPWGALSQRLCGVGQEVYRASTGTDAERYAAAQAAVEQVKTERAKAPPKAKDTPAPKAEPSASQLKKLEQAKKKKAQDKKNKPK